MRTLVFRNIILAFCLTILAVATSCSGKQESKIRLDGNTAVRGQVSPGGSSKDGDSNRVSVYLRDGSTILGNLLVDSVALRTAYATLNLDVRLISTIDLPTDNKPATISLASAKDCWERLC